MHITVRINTNYGVRVVYPHCETSKLLAELAGTRTITSDALKIISALGFEIFVYQPIVAYNLQKNKIESGE